MYFGRQYLNSEFYSLLKDSDFRRHLVLILGEDSEGNVVGGTINVVKVRGRPGTLQASSIPEAQGHSCRASK